LTRNKDDDSDGRASQAKKGKYKTCIRARASSQRPGESALEQKKGKETQRDRRKETLQQASQLTQIQGSNHPHLTQKERGKKKKTHRLSLRLNPPQLPTTATQRGHGIRNKTPIIPNSGGKIKTTSSFQLLISPASNLATKTELCRWFP
jgi:hypothetical protein